jgi:hypothetical protein
VPVTRRPHVRRFLFSRVPHFTGGIKGCPRRRAARSPSKQAARSYCRAGGSLGGFASSTQAGFAACGPRQDAVCKSLPRRGPVSPTPQAPLPARIARNRPDDALSGREREEYRIIFPIIYMTKQKPESSLSERDRPVKLSSVEPLEIGSTVVWGSLGPMEIGAVVGCSRKRPATARSASCLGSTEDSCLRPKA